MADDRTPIDPATGEPRKDYRPGPIPESVAWSVTSYLISGPLMLGGLGWLLDRWLHTGFLVLIGILAGMALSLYLIWFRYGTG
ncbi:hypothetical protein G9U51_11365 [Calidifontibacter sp. DB0510]|uniref:AtpZ/AtpI family protein n=1 Tax=Metallococcus carri TaxID=1656884 RepID=A0A967B075_9MICO|nr:AtpZ/AtpI family protein [Metallococcus carri]NHN56376.1 hypothetical protein [Metallococcus carri]NOP36000.1 hypothetical protein [Calidifontibacter sp. DB2511S]